jgi:hypothetical protein
MKSILATVLILTMGSPMAIGAPNADIPTKDVYVNASDVFVPADQTSDKDAFVVVSGMFPNSCYAMKKAEVRNDSDLEHTIKLVATVSQGMCLMVIVPFTKQISLGRLAKGEHILRFVNGDDTYFERTLTIQ